MVHTSVYAITVSQKRFDGRGMDKVAQRQTHNDIGNVRTLIDNIVFKNINK